jgi:ATP-dependent protease ClpP protease subunit
MRDFALFILAVLATLARYVLESVAPPRPFLALAAFGALASPRALTPSDSPIASVLALKANAAGDEYELLIYGYIGDSWWENSVGAKSVVESLNALPDTVKTIQVRINSVGGSVVDGFAIFNALKRHKATKVVTVDGLAASIASLIAMAGDTVRVPATSLVMIHAPWGFASGNANDMRAMAQALDTYADAMTHAYVAKSGKTKAQILALFNDGADHYYTGEQAVEEGFADELVELDDAPEPDEAEARALATTLVRSAISNNTPFATSQQVVTAALRGRVPPRIRAAMNQAATATTENDMNRKLMLVAALAALCEPAGPDGAAGGSGAAAATKPGAAPGPAATPAGGLDVTALRARNDQVHATLNAHRATNPAIASLYDEALRDPTMTLDTVNARALAIFAAAAQPLAGGASAPGANATAGADEADKIRAAGVDYLLARGAVLDAKAGAAARQGNPFAGMTLADMAEAALVRAGQSVKGRNRQEVVRAAITHSTSDFPVLLENAMHKVIIGSFRAAEDTWRSFCSVGSLADFRPHIRIVPGSFSDLRTVLPNGDYQHGTLADGEKNSIQGVSKGRLIGVSHEMLVNDDVGAFVSMGQHMGRGAKRTLNKDVFALLAQNTNTGPTMSDSVVLFHSSHANVGAAAAPTVAQLDAMRVLLKAQKAPRHASQATANEADEYLDLTPAVLLAPDSLFATLTVLNDGQFDPADNKLMKPNAVRGIARAVVTTPRLSGTRYYMFADPNVSPVIEVGFVEGQQEPQIAIEEAFRSNGLTFRVSYDYGVGAVDYRGAVTSAGAA